MSTSKVRSIVQSSEIARVIQFRSRKLAQGFAKRMQCTKKNRARFSISLGNQSSCSKYNVGQIFLQLNRIFGIRSYFLLSYIYLIFFYVTRLSIIEVCNHAHAVICTLLSLARANIYVYVDTYEFE